MGYVYYLQDSTCLLFESNFTLLIVFLIYFWKFEILSQVIEMKLFLFMNSCVSLVFALFIVITVLPLRSLVSVRFFPSVCVFIYVFLFTTHIVFLNVYFCLEA